MYSIGEKIVYPMHGTGYIESIEEKEIAGTIAQYYNIHIINGNIKLCLPVESKADIQLRPISSEDEAAKVLADFEETVLDPNITWTKRYQKNLERMKIGNLENVALVVKELMIRDITNGLSTGDRKMLILSRNILTTELALVLGKNEQELADHLAEVVHTQLNK